MNFMRKISLLLWLVLAWAGPGRAQVTVELSLAQENFLLGEKIPVAVRVTNRSGQSLRLGETEDWLTFAMTSRREVPVPRQGETPVQGAFTLESGQVATRRADLAPYFTLDQVGRYQVTAQVRIDVLNLLVDSAPKSFYLVNGAKIWSEEFGLPGGVLGTNQVPVTRRYTLEQASHYRSQQQLYLRLTQGADHVLKVFPLGPMVSISHPEAQLDRSNHLHVLYQHTARAYLYLVVSPDGEVARRETHDITNTRPRLRRDELGGFQLLGGARRYTATDLPAPEPAPDNVPDVAP